MLSKGNMNRDPLELARAQLDFAAMGAAAPSVREVLYKAQTMVPLAPTKPWWKLGATVGGALVLAAALLAPWVPATSKLALLSLQFDKLYTRAEAQQLISQALRDLPENVLAGAEYTPLGDADSGKLSINATSFTQSAGTLDKLASSMRWDDTKDLASDVSYNTEKLYFVQWTSPVQLAGRLINPQHHVPALLKPSRDLALDVLNHQPLYQHTLAEELAAGDPAFKLTALEFIESRGPVLERHYDFELPAWPAPLGVSAENFTQLSASQQAALRQHVEGFARRMNLADCNMVLASEPQPWMPVLVNVCNTAGASDRLVSERVQAWLEKPTDDELADPEFSLTALIGRAMEHVLPGMDYRVDYMRAGLALPNGLHPYFYATVTVLGTRRNSLRPINASGESEETAEY